MLVHRGGGYADTAPPSHTMAERTLVPGLRPIVQFNGHRQSHESARSSPLRRAWRARDVNREAYSVTEDHRRRAATDMTSARVPVNAAPAGNSSYPLHVPEDLVDPDVSAPGKFNSLSANRKKRRPSGSSLRGFLPSRFTFSSLSYCCSKRAIPSHGRLKPKWNRAKQMNRAASGLTGGAEPSIGRSTATRGPRRSARFAESCPAPGPNPAPQPERPARELPKAPVPKSTLRKLLPKRRPTRPAKAPLKLETPDTPQPRSSLSCQNKRRQAKA